MAALNRETYEPAAPVNLHDPPVPMIPSCAAVLAPWAPADDMGWRGLARATALRFRVDALRRHGTHAPAVMWVRRSRQHRRTRPRSSCDGCSITQADRELHALPVILEARRRERGYPA